MNTFELPAAVLALIPPLGSQELVADPLVYALLHRPGEQHAWFVTERSGDDAFGWIVDRRSGEFGQFWLPALAMDGPESITVESADQIRVFLNRPHATRITCDPCFSPRSLSEAKTYYQHLWSNAAEAKGD